MREYVVVKPEDSGDNEVYYSLKLAKAALRNNPGSKCFAYKIYSNGDFVPLGEITLSDRNCKLVVGATRQTKSNYD